MANGAVLRHTLRVLARVALPLAAVAALVAAGTAGGSSQLIRHGVGIGKVRLGMTEAQVRRALGRPTSVVRRRAGFGGARTELQFDEASYTVVLRRRSGAMRVVAVSTILERERTREGLGVGTLEARVRRAYGSRLRCERLRTEPVDDRTSARMLMPPERNCVLTVGGAQTVFRSVVKGRWPWSRLTPADWPRARVYVVSVRLPGA